jgi:hypothetical protein
MISEITKTHVKQECQCGSHNLVSYQNITYVDKGLAQFRFPLCAGCQSRVEFVFMSTNMSKEQFQLMVKMKELGLMEK